MATKAAVSEQPAPLHNDLLAALPPEDYERLAPQLEFLPAPGCSTCCFASPRP